MSSETPHTVREAKMLRGNAKRKITNLVKDGISLLQSDEGIPCDEYKLLADMIREHLDILQVTVDHVIKFKCEELKVAEYKSEKDLDNAEQEIATIEQVHFDEAQDNSMPIVRDLIRHAKRLLDAESPTPQPHSNRSNQPVSSHARLAKLKFPTFSGDLRDYKLFKKQFLHYSQHLDEIECFYQLVESMEKAREKNKIKSCSSTTRAWEILDEFYGDDDQIVETLIGDLEKMNSYDTKGHIDIFAMEKFVESLQNFESQMDSLGKSEDLSGRFLVSQVRRKLPEEHRISYLKSVRDDGLEDSLSGLVRWLHSQLVLLKKAKGSTDSSDTQKSHYPYKPQKTHINKSSNVSTMSPGATNNSRNYNRDNYSKHGSNVEQGNTDRQPKCPLHQQNNNHYLKGCNKFKTLTQKEKFEIMNTNGICHRCGHNNCVAGKSPRDYEHCQFIQPCQIPTCGVDTHFSSICPRVYGNEGYNHFDKNQRSFRTESNEQTTSKKSNSLTILPKISNTDTVVSTTLNAVNEISETLPRISSVLPTVVANLKIGSTKIPVRILLDSGSQLSLVRKGLIKKFDGELQDFRITTVGGATMTHRLRVVDCDIESLDGTFTRKVRLTEMDKPCGEIPIITNTQIKQYPHMNNIEIEEASSETIDILLGVENGDLLTSEQYILGPNEDDPIAAKCPLGWYVQGGRYNETPNNSIMNFMQVSAVSEIEDFLGIERMGIEPRRCKCSIDAEEKSATEQMQNSVTRLEDGVYQINLPWKKSPLELPNNYDYAVKRLINLEKQFKNRPREWETYCKQMDDQVSRGVAREVAQHEVDTDNANGTKMWFLPHFGVVKDLETTPVRVVYDGKARFQGHSLNDYLAKGHNMNVDLFDIGLRFREYEVGVIADISKMFQAVKMVPDDARFHRYLFRKHPEDPIKVYELTTVTFGDKPSPAAAIIALRHVAAENVPDDPEIQRIANNQFYVDDLTDSQRSTDEAHRLKSNLTSTLEKGNFNIRKWLSNKPTLCDTEFYPINDVTTVLGTRWNLKTDTLSVKEVLFKDFVPTKRNILKMTASYYDVYGMLSGILVRPKILLQQLWQYDINWDDPIHPDSDLYMMLNKIKKDLQDVDSIEIKRCLIPEKFHGQSELPKMSLHGFSDASEDAMGIGVWMRWSNEDDEAELTFVCAKARLTPLKQSSIPRKELQAILLLSRLSNGSRYERFKT